MVEVTATFTEGAVELMKGFAAEKGLTLTEYVKQAVLDRLEDDEDLRDAEAAYAEYLKNPVTYSLEEIKAELGLNEIVQGENVVCRSQEIEEDGLCNSGAHSKLA